MTLEATETVVESAKGRGFIKLFTNRAKQIDPNAT